ncbi:MAG: endonuclease Q family protein [Patescibacteria group bacterium]|nr:endonuclease Q family protein [Patescibacteria group bacterium]
MRIIADLHLHSKWSRACSQDLALPNIAKACERKGIDLVGTADALHPKWSSDIKELLVESGTGVFSLKDGSSPTRFLLTVEVSSIYKRGGKVRRVHHVLLFPGLEALDAFSRKLSDRGVNLKSDGRPIMGLDSEELLKLLLDADENCLLIPAHAWTPWFSIFGSKSGFDSIEECFGDMSKYIYAIETGLSSDPLMNWRLSALDHVFLVSNSDAHSCANLGREANVFDMERVDYPELWRIIVEHDTARFIETLEFFPEEGKYHADGHRDCSFWCLPEETKKNHGICPKCGKPLTIGVLNRVAELADRPPDPVRPSGSAPFRSIVPLAEVVAGSLGVSKASKKVVLALENLLSSGRTEFGILLDYPEESLVSFASPELVSAIMSMRQGKVEIRPGYDGEFGLVNVMSGKQRVQANLL